MNRYWTTARNVDERMQEAGIPYCIIKTYGGHEEFNDGNIDVVCPGPLAEVHHRAFADHSVNLRDITKAILYERNKRMVKPETDATADIHLHTNAGWHNLEFMSGEEILENRIRRELDGGGAWILAPEPDERVLTLQIMFENFRKKPWDLRVLDDANLDDFASTYAISADEIAKVKAAELNEPLPREALKPIWRKYYAKRRNETSIGPWNHFLHFLLFEVQSWRMKRMPR